MPERATLKHATKALHGRLVFERRTRVLSERMSHLFPAHSHVLDVGTGDGRIASLWKQMRPDITVEGIDVFVRGATHIPVREFDGTSIPYSDKSVDVVSFVDVLHHTSDVPHLLKEAARVARKKVVIKDHLSESRVDHATLRLMDWVGNAPHGVVLPYNYLSKQTWLSYFHQVGLRVDVFDDSIPLYAMPFSLIFVRRLHFIAQLTPGA
jgi:ubiquinone/menaquinone biosynthesis C-methylase UbiE